MERPKVKARGGATEQKVEELAVCTYLDHLDKIARLFMIADCANGVLCRAHVGGLRHRLVSAV